MSMPPVVSVVILAAGESRRMGQPKLLLPWGQRTVLEQVIATFTSALPVKTKADFSSGGNLGHHRGSPGAGRDAVGRVERPLSPANGIQSKFRHLRHD